MIETSTDLKRKCRKVLGLGRNYYSSSGNTIPKPFIFLKPTTTLITEGDIVIPKEWTTVKHEVELGIIIGEGGKRIREEDAMDHILGYVLALDMTASLDITKHEMLLMKGFDTSTPIGEFINKEALPDPHNVSLKLKVNGETRQDGNTRDLVWRIPKMISYLSDCFTLEEGDLILTGTPDGASQVKDGDLIYASLNDTVQVNFKVVQEQ